MTMEHTTDDSPAGRGPASGPTMSARIEYLARTLAEMEQGMRRIDTLDPLASPLAARRIRKVVYRAQAMGAAARAGTSRPRTATPKVRRSSFSHPSAGVAEGTVIIERDARTRAYCVRLERERDRWRIVELAPVDAGLRPAITTASREGQLPVDEDGVPRSSGPGGTGFSAPPMPGQPGLVIDPEDKGEKGAADESDGATDEPDEPNATDEPDATDGPDGPDGEPDATDGAPD